MNEIFLVGLIAAVITSLSFLPQLVRVIKYKKTDELSLATFVVLCMGSLLWIIYGIMVRDIPIISLNTVVAIIAILILSFKLRYG